MISKSQALSLKAHICFKAEPLLLDDLIIMRMHNINEHLYCSRRNALNCPSNSISTAVIPTDERTFQGMSLS